MEQKVQDKIDRIIAFAKGKPALKVAMAKPSVAIADNLSKAIRTKKDAEAFQRELEAVLANK